MNAGGVKKFKRLIGFVFDKGNVVDYLDGGQNERRPKGLSALALIASTNIAEGFFWRQMRRLISGDVAHWRCQWVDSSKPLAQNLDLKVGTCVVDVDSCVDIIRLSSEGVVVRNLKIKPCLCRSWKSCCLCPFHINIDIFPSRFVRFWSKQKMIIFFRHFKTIKKGIFILSWRALILLINLISKKCSEIGRQRANYKYVHKLLSLFFSPTEIKLTLLCDLWASFFSGWWYTQLLGEFDPEV